jgi:hypothetical protein
VRERERERESERERKREREREREKLLWARTHAQHAANTLTTCTSSVHTADGPQHCLTVSTRELWGPRTRNCARRAKTAPRVLEHARLDGEILRDGAGERALEQGRGAGGMRVPGGRVDARVRDAKLACAGDACDAPRAVGACDVCTKGAGPARGAGAGAAERLRHRSCHRRNLRGRSLDSAAHKHQDGGQEGGGTNSQKVPRDFCTLYSKCTRALTFENVWQFMSSLSKALASGKHFSKVLFSVTLHSNMLGH